jgi:hypothetical protein
MTRLYVALLAALAAMGLGACRSGTDSRAEALDLLRESAAEYASLQSFEAVCAWRTEYSGGRTSSQTRTIAYASPNKFRVESKAADGSLETSVCDGRTNVEFTGEPMLGTWRVPAPKTLAEAKASLISNEQLCGLALFRFFAGPEAWSDLAGSAAPVRLGPDVMLDGVKCRTVEFYEERRLGHVERAIGVADKLVRRISFDSEPLTRKAQSLAPHTDIPRGVTFECYTDISVNKHIEESKFDVSRIEVPDSHQLGAGDR